MKMKEENEMKEVDCKVCGSKMHKTHEHKHKGKAKHKALEKMKK